jgi:hypothetical protein
MRLVGDSPRIETGPIRVVSITDLQFVPFADIWPVKFMPQKILFTCLVFNDLAPPYILSD